MRRPCLLFLAAGLIACPAEPEPVGEPARESRPPAPWVFHGSVEDWGSGPIAEAELRIGEASTLTDADGRYEIPQDGGFPVQVDLDWGGSSQRSAITCIDQHDFYVSAGGGARGGGVTLELLFTERSEAPTLEIGAALDYADFSFVSVWSWADLSLEQVDENSWRYTLTDLPALNGAEFFAVELVDGAAVTLASASIGAASGGETVSLTMALRPLGGATTPWDGVVPEPLDELIFREAIPALGASVYLTALRMSPDGGPRQLPVLDGTLGVIEYQVEAVPPPSERCAMPRSSLDLAPIFPPAILTLPELPSAPELWAVDAGDGLSRPELNFAFSWNQPSLPRQDVVAMGWDEDSVRVLDWQVDVDHGCGERVSWPPAVPSLPQGGFVWLTARTYAAGAWSTCAIDPRGPG